jgi:hypothetical protein
MKSLSGTALNDQGGQVGCIQPAGEIACHQIIINDKLDEFLGLIETISFDCSPQGICFWGNMVFSSGTIGFQFFQG